MTEPVDPPPPAARQSDGSSPAPAAARPRPGPLGRQLQGLAGDLHAGRLRRGLLALANRLEAGVPLDRALADAGSAIPHHMGGLIVAAARTGRLDNVLEELARDQRTGREAMRRVWSSLAYPLLVLMLTFFLLQMFLWLIVPELGSLYDNFELDLPGFTLLTLVVAQPRFAWFPLVLMLLLGGVILVQALFPGGILGRSRYYVPLLGRLWLWSGFAEFADLLGTLIRYDVPLPEALLLVADAVRDLAVAQECRDMAAGIESGKSLAQCLADSPSFPESFVALVRSGEQAGSLSESLRIAGNIYAERVQLQAGLASSVLPALLFLLILILASLLITSLYLPLVDLVTGLS